MAPPPLIPTSFHAAEWFLDRALNDGEYLQPQKLHRLLFLAQAYYGVAKAGRMLMPAIFVADPMGPLEPNLYRAYENERPWITKQVIDPEGVQFLDGIWRRFGVHSADHLTKVIAKHPPYAEALGVAPGSVISLEAMIAFYGATRVDVLQRREDTGGGVSAEEQDARHAMAAPPVEKVVRPRVMRSHTGKAVNVMPWMPKKK
ncbi:MAG: Panacea domain-containing protein [Rhodospirillaceae bacterium]